MGVDLTISKDGDEVNFPKRGDEVTIHYSGYLKTKSGNNIRGKKFDSSVDRGDPFKCKIGVGQVIRGWDEAIPKLSLGTKATLDISSDYAYGKSGFGSVIPPNSDLIFDIELLGINNLKA
ncbi:hypothetical protein C1645_882748 [Glomus cerebriforme]|uniref:peptidylprolyl isomerase n=1 Tax=Glomus cerebriforme TaxID=658196 RepID=A0A397S371_9GLOM|nr:hypothetical protein C1645_882748 [Glomus cerebriforme]